MKDIFDLFEMELNSIERKMWSRTFKTRQITYIWEWKKKLLNENLRKVKKDKFYQSKSFYSFRDGAES